MADEASPQHWTWQRQDGPTHYLISTSPEFQDLDFINQAFDTEDMYWAKPLARDQLQLALANSTTLSLFSSTSNTSTSSDIKASLTPLGFARIVTDKVTFAYLTDVYIVPSSQGLGLGKWLIKCCQDVFKSMQGLRRVILFTKLEVSKKFYKRELQMWDTKDEGGGMTTMAWKPEGMPKWD